MKMEADRGIINFMLRSEKGQVYFNTISFKGLDKKGYNISYRVADSHAEFDVIYDPETDKISLTKKGKGPSINELDLKILELMMEYPLERGMHYVCKSIYEKYTMFDNPKMSMKEGLEKLTEKDINNALKDFMKKSKEEPRIC